MRYSVETQIKLNKFVARPYQIPIFDAIENKGYKKVMLIGPRRMGKDVLAFNVAIRYALENVCVIYYCFPTFSLARRALWDNITIDGFRILNYIPDEIIESTNEQQMRVKLRNGSIIQLIGSDNYNETLVGTNPKMIVFSEYALQDPMAYQFARPILAANGGVALFVSTPRSGKKSHVGAISNSKAITRMVCLQNHH